MELPIRGQLGVKSQGQQMILPNGDHCPVREPADDLDPVADLGDPRSPDEDRGERLLTGYPFQLEGRLEAVDLPAKGVARHRDIHQAQARLIGCLDAARQHDHARAGTQDGATGSGQLADRFDQVVLDQQLSDGGALANRNDQAVEALQCRRAADLDGVHTQPAERRHVLGKRALERQHPDLHGQPLLSLLTSAPRPVHYRSDQS